MAEKEDLSLLVIPKVTPKVLPGALVEGSGAHEDPGLVTEFQRDDGGPEGLGGPARPKTGRLLISAC